MHYVIIYFVPTLHFTIQILPLSCHTLHVRMCIYDLEYSFDLQFPENYVIIEFGLQNSEIIINYNIINNDVFAPVALVFLLIPEKRETFFSSENSISIKKVPIMSLT